MTATQPAEWESFLEKNFPGYLLPQSSRYQVTEEVARAFLDALGIRVRDLELLRFMSLLAAHSGELEAFAADWLPDLVRVLPSRTLVKRREWRGGYQGRLDVSATLAKRMAGESDVYLTRARFRDFELPENVFVRAVAERTVRLLARLHMQGLLKEVGWTDAALRSLSSLQHTLQATVLREVEAQRVNSHHLQAARNARHPAYSACLTWYRAMSDALDSSDPERLARILAEGALRPLDRPKRFEVAVVLSLLRGLAQRLPAEDGWILETRVIAPGRREIAVFKKEGQEIGVYYDQAVLPLDKTLGARDAGVLHYLASGGRLRPDITVRTRSIDGYETFTVFEIKLTDDLGYVANGYGEAIVYRHEYADSLTGWPKAVVVTSCPVSGPVSRAHDVVATRWSELAGSEVLDGILEGLSVVRV